MKEPSPFTDALYDHHFDIDQILTAFCAETSCWLNSRTGQITPKKPDEPEKFTHKIEPLPMSFIEEISLLAKRAHLHEKDAEALGSFIKHAEIQDLPAFFDEGFAGGFVRESVKNVALEWLDEERLIPPSMRHVRPARDVTGPVKGRIKIMEQ